MSWNYDNYNQRIEESTHRNESSFRLYNQRQSIAFMPTEHEHLEQYIQRLTNAVEELQQISIASHINGKKMWYTHRTPSQCWICEQINISLYSVEILNQLPEEIKKNLQFEYDKSKNLILTDQRTI